MKNTRHSLKGYKIDYYGNTIYLNKKFSKKAQDYGSPEYDLLQKLLFDLPNMKVVVRSGRNVNKTAYNYRVSYKHMESHMLGRKNTDKLLEMFELAKLYSQPLASPYKYVCDWFRKQFPDYKDPIASVGITELEPKIVGLPDPNDYEKKESYIA